MTASNAALKPTIHPRDFRIKPGSSVNLAKLETKQSGSFASSEDSHSELRFHRERIIALQERLWAEHKQSLLVILQATDTGGKDGTVRHVFEGVNPQGVVVTSFKQPTPDELDHDYLWRIHQHTPAKGEIAIFNRSQYEDVLVVRVHDLVPKRVWEKRYDQINDFEERLVETGTTIVKIFLHISKEEQKERLEARLDDPDKRWKFNLGDLTDREKWDDFQKAYQDMLERCSTNFAPWYVVPADRKWYRNVVVAAIVADTLEKMDPQFPKEAEGLDEIVIPD
ncbi:MAG: polyphosphate kinase 2 family protein [Thermomicrobiales bacterium]